MNGETETFRYNGFPVWLFERERGIYSRLLLWVVLAVAVWLSFAANLKYAALPKWEFVSVLGWLFPGDAWGHPFWLILSRIVLIAGGGLWLFGPVRTRRVAAWSTVAAMLLLGSLYWENLPWFRHKYVPPFWLLLLLAVKEHATESRDEAPRWVREGAVFILGVFYGGAGIAKLLESGVAWTDGVALQLWFWELDLKGGMIWEWMMNSPHLARMIGTAVMLLELGCLLAIPFMWVRIPLGIGLLIMHLCIEIVLGIDFRTNMLLVSVIYFPWFTQRSR